MANQQLVIALYENEAAADAAVTQIKEWDNTIEGVRLGAIEVLVKDDKGKIKTHKLGPHHTVAGVLIGALVGILTGGIGLIAGAAIGGLAGSLIHKGLRLSQDDIKHLNTELDGGKAAVVAVVEYGKASAVAAWMADLGGKVESYDVTDEAIKQAAATVQDVPEEKPSTEVPPTISKPDMSTT
jgi:uncharacterized membrane protein